MTTATIDHPLIQSAARERRVLSFIALDGAEAMEVCAKYGIMGDSFTGAAERQVFELAAVLQERRQLFPGSDCLAEEAMKAGIPPRIYVDLTTQIPDYGMLSVELPRLCQELRRLERERKMHKAATTVAAALNANDPERATAAIAALQDADATARPRVTWKQTGAVQIERAQAVMAGTEDPDADSIRWPWRPFDVDFKPLRRGELCVVAGFASLGKSSLMRQIALHSARVGQNTAFISMEVPAADIFNLMAASHGGQSFSRFKTMHAADQADFLRSARAVRELPIEVLDDTTDLREILAWVRGFHQRRFVDIVFVDYLGLVRECQPTRNQTKAAAVGEVACAFKRLATELKCVVILGVQINRGPMNQGNREPMLTDLKDSGDIEAHADRVEILYRPDRDKSGNSPQSTHDAIIDRPRFYTEIFQEKGRNVGTGMAALWFNRELAKFELIAR